MVWYRFVLYLQTLSACVAPRHAESYTRYIISRFGLDKKYGEDSAHIDRIFERLYCPHCGRYVPGYDGWRLKSILNVHLRISKMRNLRCYGIFTDEECIVLHKKSITLTNGVRTLLTYEIVPPGTMMHAVFDVEDINDKSCISPEEVKKRLETLVGREIVNLGLRSRGFNRMRLVKFDVHRLEQVEGVPR